jgi:hypothetical protein
MKDFLFAKGWFDSKYAKPGHRRHATMKAALNLFLQNGGSNIVETGCCRLPDDWGAGLSTVMFGDFCKKYTKRLYTVDLSPENMAICRDLTKEYNGFIDYHVEDSVSFLKRFDQTIDLLYLDSYDYPYGELLEIYGGKTDIDKAIIILDNMSDEDIVSRHSAVIAASQEHCLKELMAALPHLSDKAPIIIDDCMLPGGGKGRTAKEWLLANNYTCILDLYQTLWVKNL